MAYLAIINNMRRNRYNNSHRFGKPVIMEHRIILDEVDEETYGYLIEWLALNIPTIDRKTPAYRDGKLIFQFRHEEHAMAFKLALPSNVLI